MNSTPDERLLAVAELRVDYSSRAALRGVDIVVRIGERVAVLGESGSGKSTLALAAAGLLDPAARLTGQVRAGGCSVRQGEPVPSRVAMVFQDSLTALNPLVRCGRQVAEPLRARGTSRRAAEKMAMALLARMRLPEPAVMARRYPGQLSGGQRQRVALALALAARPALLVADEPTSALDTTVQADVLRVLHDIVDPGVPGAAEALLLVTHDLSIAAAVCERVIVLRCGSVVVDGPTAQVLDVPAHPYVRELVDAARQLTLRAAVPVPA